MRRKIKPTVDNYYHIYNRGVNYQNIFFNQENWLFFLRLLRRYCTPRQSGDHRLLPYAQPLPHTQ
jgi:hypothetical protein